MITPQRPDHHRVVVTGMGAVTPIGLGVAAFWRALLDGRSGAAPITRFDPAGFDTTFACELKGFDARAVTDRKLANRLDPVCHHALAAADTSATRSTRPSADRCAWR